MCGRDVEGVSKPTLFSVVRSASDCVALIGYIPACSSKANSRYLRTMERPQPPSTAADVLMPPGPIHILPILDGSPSKRSWCKKKDKNALKHSNVQSIILPNSARVAVDRHWWAAAHLDNGSLFRAARGTNYLTPHDLNLTLNLTLAFTIPDTTLNLNFNNHFNLNPQ